jgi:hypothetical protein
LSTVSRGLETSESKPEDAAGGARSRVDLNGPWERTFDEKLYDLVQVPSLLRPSGSYSLKRQFLLPELSRHERAILHFDAITYFGRAFVNGMELGTMVPYVPCEFDFIGTAKTGTNAVEATIADLAP